MKYLLGRWVWNAVLPRWEPPADALSWIDLRNLAAQATPSTVQGYVLFAANRDPVGDELLIADGAVLTGKALDGVKDLLGIPEALAVSTLPELVRRLLAVYSDPDVGLICPPLMPDRRGVMRFSLGDISEAYPIQKSGAEWDNVLKVIQEQYRTVKGDPSTAPDLHQKMLAVWQQKFRIADHEVFIPHDLPKEQPIKPTTTIQDNFNVGNHADINGQVSSDGWTWTRVQGGATALYRTNTGNDAEIVCSSSGRCVYRADSDLSSTDHYVQGTIRTNSDNLQVGVIARKDSSATITMYEVMISTAGDVLSVSKYVSGTGSSVGTRALTLNTATGYDIRLNISGSTLQVFNSLSQVGSNLTDSSISSGTRCGMSGQVSGALPETGGIEDFLASDGLSAAGGGAVYLHQKQMRA